MESKNLLTLAITLTVGIILAGSLLMPVISDATTTEKTFDNTANALFQVEKLDDSSEYTFVWDHTDPTHATVNGSTVTLKNATVLCSTDSFLFRFGSDTASGSYIQSIGANIGMIVSEKGTNEGDLTITASGGTFTFETVKGGTTATKTLDFTEGYGIVAEGSYVMKSPTQTAYMLKDSPIVAMGLTSLDGVWNNLFQITGTVEEVTITQIIPTPATYTISDIVINSQANDKYIDLYSLDSITFVATQIADNTKVHDCTYNFFIVPATVTAELSQHLSPGEIAIMNALPVLIIVALVMMAAGALYLKRDD